MAMLAVLSFGCGEKQFSTGVPGDGDLGGTGGDGGGGDGDGDTGGSAGGRANQCDSCTGDTPACNTDEECVECTATQTSACTGDTTLCDADSETCVACLENTDCTDSTAPVCDDGTCTTCSESNDCAHLSATPSCETDSGACVECLPPEDDRESDADACGTGVCDPETHQCDWTKTQGTLGACEECIADAECVAGHNCIPLEYTGGVEPEPVGNFCMKVFPGCSRPYQAGAITRVSASGLEATEYCGIAEEDTTCPALNDVGTPYPGGVSQCGAIDGDAVCGAVNGSLENQCSTPCPDMGGDPRCVSGFDCDGAPGNKYCGG